MTESDREARSWLVGSDEGARLVAFRNEKFLSDIDVGLNNDGEYKLTIIGVQQTEDGLWHCQQKNQIVKKIRLYVDGKGCSR